MERCDRCGFVWDALAAEQIAPALRIVADQYRSRVVGLDPAAGATGGAAGPWSPLDHLAHLQRVLANTRTILLGGSSARHTSWSAGPDAVAAVEAAARTLADHYDEHGDAWTRPTGEGPDPVELGRDAVHQLSHHLFAVARLVDDAASPASG